MTDSASLIEFVIPAALGAAWSPTILLLSTKILSGTRRPRPRATAFWIGGMVALVVWALLVYSAFWAWFQRAASNVVAHLDAIEIVLGVLLLLVGLVSLVEWRLVVRLGRRHRDDSSETTANEDTSPDGLVRVGLLGLVMQGRDVSSIILYIAILGHLAQPGIPMVERLSLNALVIGIITVAFWLPLITHFTIPTSFRHRVAPLQSWLVDHGKAVTVVIAWTLGAYLIWHAAVHPHAG